MGEACLVEPYHMVTDKTSEGHPWVAFPLEELPLEEHRKVPFLEEGNQELLEEVHNLEVHCSLEVLHNLEVAFHLEEPHREDILAYYESNKFN